jgi:hypothetical protein
VERKECRGFVVVSVGGEILFEILASKIWGKS